MSINRLEFYICSGDVLNGDLMGASSARTSDESDSPLPRLHASASKMPTISTSTTSARAARASTSPPGRVPPRGSWPVARAGAAADCQHQHPPCCSVWQLPRRCVQHEAEIRDSPPSSSSPWSPPCCFVPLPLTTKTYCDISSITIVTTQKYMLKQPRNIC